MTVEARGQGGGDVGGQVAIPLPAQRGDGIVQLVDHQQVTASRVEGEVPGAGPRRHVDPPSGPFEQLALVAEVVGQDGIEAEIGHEHGTVGRVEHDHVGVRPGLADRMDAGALVLHVIGHRADAAVGLEPEHGDRT